MSAWIETEAKRFLLGGVLGRTLMSAWIETVKQQHLELPLLVALS